jgi:hypothetical protein
MSLLLTDVAIVVALAVLIGFYLSWRASRLDRLHTRVETARAALDAALVRRSAVVLELASSGLLDPATSLLFAGAAHDARAAGQLGVELAGGEPAGGEPAQSSPGPTSPGPYSPDQDSREQAREMARELAESDLSRALRAAFTLPGFRESLAGKDGAAELLAELEGAAHQVFLARKFYNDAVAATLAARRRRLVRLLHLAGGAMLAQFFEIDDAPPSSGDGDDGADMPRLTG